jgi:hypothetical protein
VRFAQDPVDHGVIVGCHLERDQAGSDPLEMALGLLDKQGSELVL